MSDHRESPRIRRAEADDVAGLIALESQAFDVDAQSRRSLRWLVTRANADVWVIDAAQDELLAAYAVTLYRTGSRVARLYSIAVASQARGQRLGQRLLLHAMQQSSQRGCTIMRAEARSSNQASRSLFAAAGFTETGRLAAYYPGPEDGVRLQKFLEDNNPNG